VGKRCRNENDDAGSTVTGNVAGNGSEKSVKLKWYQPEQTSRPDNHQMVESIFAGRAAKERWQRLDGIDCLRALAIFYVLMNHVNMRLWGAHIPYMPGWPHQLVPSPAS
jgi:hypothetical protein